MRNIETRITKTGPDDAGLNQLLTDARMEERRVHHYGLRDRVSRKGPEVRYAERRLLGVNDEVETVTRDTLLRWLAG